MDILHWTWKIELQVLRPFVDGPTWVTTDCDCFTDMRGEFRSLKRAGATVAYTRHGDFVEDHVTMPLGSWNAWASESPREALRYCRSDTGQPARWASQREMELTVSVDPLPFAVVNRLFTSTPIELPSLETRLATRLQWWAEALRVILRVGVEARFVWNVVDLIAEYSAARDIDSRVIVHVSWGLGQLC